MIPILIAIISLLNSRIERYPRPIAVDDRRRNDGKGAQRRGKNNNNNSGVLLLQQILLCVVSILFHRLRVAAM